MLGKKRGEGASGRTGGEAQRIRDWKGLLGGEGKRIRTLVFALLLLVSAGMTFTQLGFIGLGPAGERLCYVFGLLAPLAACALLLGKGPGFLFGLASGAVLLLHAFLQPLDLYERYLASPLNSVVLYAFTGLLLGLLLAVALHRDPKGVRRGLGLFLISLLVSPVVSALFTVNAMVDVMADAILTVVNDPEAEAMAAAGDVTRLLPDDTISAIFAVGGSWLQPVADLVLMLAVMLACDRLVRRWRETRDSQSVRILFRTRLFVAVMVAYVVVQAGIFAFTTMAAEAEASRDLGEQADYIAFQFAASDAAATDASSGTLYSPSDETVLVFEDDALAYSSSDAYRLGETAEEAFDNRNAAKLRRAGRTGELVTMAYGAETMSELLAEDASLAEGEYAGELGYARALEKGNLLVVAMEPAPKVFAHRSETVGWGSLLALALAAAAYAAATALIRRDVASPVDRINASLGKITQGDLDELVREVGTVEFASLSAGINSTVDALKGLIDESERRMERDLATAKAIQESALPRTFPPFPAVDAFDIYASMDAAKEVGGDFYDFFLVDGHTLGFLIADVSGKGIPGALFMMAAKAEIENYLSTGMAPAEAIASANKRLCANNDAGMFVTVWAATLDWDTGLVTYVNAGHNYPLLRHGRGGSWEWLKERCGFFLGAFETAEYRQETLTLEPGDELLLYTDGVNEAFNVDDEEFGNDRLEAYLATHADLCPEDLVRGLRGAVADWAEGAEQSDDVTILALEFGAAPQLPSPGV